MEGINIKKQFSTFLRKLKHFREKIRRINLKLGFNRKKSEKFVNYKTKKNNFFFFILNQ